MTLNLENLGLKTIFSHARELNQGSGNIRKGQSTYVVALDGSGDFSSIQEAINALPSIGGEIFIKEGTYKISTTINLKSNVSLTGIGASSILAATSTTMTIISASSKTNITIKNLKIQDTSANSATSKGIYFLNTTNSFIIDCFLTNCYYPIYLEFSDENTIGYNKLSGNTGFNIYIDSSDSNIISGNISGSGGNYSGLYLSSVTDPASSYNVIVGNYFCNAQDGIYINTTANNNIISGNNCSNNSRTGIIINNGSYNSITGNSCFDNGGGGTFDCGILLDSVTRYNTVSGNNCCNNNKYGIHLQDSNVANNIIIGNLCYGNTTAGYLNNGTTTEIAHNRTA